MPTTTNFALPYPASTATVNVSGDIQALATATDTALATVSADKPHAFLRQTSNQSIVFGAWTAVTFDTEDVDTHSGHSTSVNTSRYTAAVAGWYHVVGRGSFAANSTGHRGVRIAKNGSVVNGSASYFQAATSDVWSSAGVGTGLAPLFSGGGTAAVPSRCTATQNRPVRTISNTSFWLMDRSRAAFTVTTVPLIQAVTVSPDLAAVAYPMTGSRPGRT